MNGRRVLLTGISGVGKSTLVAELAARGHRAVDLDTPEFSHWVEVAAGDATPGTPVEPGRDWMWREDRVEGLLSVDEGGVLYVSGCAANMGRFMGRFDEVILLSAGPDVITHRLATRTTNSYGRNPAELARVLDQRTSVEPLLRRAADREIDTGRPLEEVLAAVIRCFSPPAPIQDVPIHWPRERGPDE
jgi:shikimate kinase